MIGTQSGSTAVAQFDTSAEMDIDSLFEGGELVEAGSVECESDGRELTDREVLVEFAPEKLEKIEDKHESLPGTKDQLIAHHAGKVRERVDVSAADDESSPLRVTISQADTRSVDERIALDENEQEYDETLDECPKCGEEEVGASRQILQTRSADESGTEIAHLECGCVTRHTD